MLAYWSVFHFVHPHTCATHATSSDSFGQRGRRNVPLKLLMFLSWRARFGVTSPQAIHKDIPGRFTACIGLGRRRGPWSAGMESQAGGQPEGGSHIAIRGPQSAARAVYDRCQATASGSCAARAAARASSRARTRSNCRPPRDGDSRPLTSVLIWARRPLPTIGAQCSSCLCPCSRR